MTISITATWLEDQAEGQRRNFQRALLASAVLHVAVVAAFALAPEQEPLRMPEVISVKLVALPPSQPAPEVAEAIPVPAPAPAPAAPKPVPVPQKVILPKQAPKVSKKKKKKAKPKPLEYDDALAALRSELGEQTPVATPEPVEIAETVQPPAQESAQEGISEPPEIVAWKRATRNHLRKVWVVPPEFMHRPLRTHLRVLLSVSGEVIGTPEIVRSSGDPYWDDNTIRALVRASPLPAPPEAGEWPFVFSPDEKN